MPKFVSARDFEFFQHINREIVDDIVDVTVILYKLKLDATPINIYGEADQKSWYEPSELTALIEYPDNVPSTEAGFGVDQTQNVDFRFVRRVLRDAHVHPEIGDILGYNDLFYEIDNIRETQLIAGRPGYNQSILCNAHLTRMSDIQIESRQI